MKWYRLIILGFYLCLSLHAAVAQNPPFMGGPLVPETLIMGKFVGVWTKSVEIIGGKKSAVDGRIDWALGNTFIQFKHTLTMDDNSKVEMLSLMTWDKTDKIYRYYQFNSKGEIVPFTGTWSEDTNTMNLKSIPSADGNVTESVYRFSTDDTLEWTYETKNKEGKSIFSLKSTDTRKKHAVPCGATSPQKTAPTTKSPE